MKQNLNLSGSTKRKSVPLRGNEISSSLLLYPKDRRQTASNLHQHEHEHDITTTTTTTTTKRPYSLRNTTYKNLLAIGDTNGISVLSNASSGQLYSQNELGLSNGNGNENININMGNGKNGKNLNELAHLRAGNSISERVSRTSSIEFPLQGNSEQQHLNNNNNNNQRDDIGDIYTTRATPQQIDKFNVKEFDSSSNGPNNLTQFDDSIQFDTQTNQSSGYGNNRVSEGNRTEYPSQANLSGQVRWTEVKGGKGGENSFPKKISSLSGSESENEIEAGKGARSYESNSNNKRVGERKKKIKETGYSGVSEEERDYNGNMFRPDSVNDIVAKVRKEKSDMLLLLGKGNGNKKFKREEEETAGREKKRQEEEQMKQIKREYKNLHLNLTREENVNGNGNGNVNVNGNKNKNENENSRRVKLNNHYTNDTLLRGESKYDRKGGKEKSLSDNDEDDEENDEDNKVTPHQYQIQLRWKNSNSNNRESRQSPPLLKGEATQVVNNNNNNDLARIGLGPRAEGRGQVDKMREQVRDRLYEHRDEEHWHEKSWLRAQRRGARIVDGRVVVDSAGPGQSKEVPALVKASNVDYGPNSRERLTPIKGQLSDWPSKEESESHFAIPSKNFRQSKNFVNWILKDVDMNED